MRKFWQILIAIIVIIMIVLGGFYFYLSTMMSREAKNGVKENQVQANVEDLQAKHNIVFMGDSLTAGFNSGGKMVTDNKGYRSVLSDQLSSVDKLGTTYNYAVGGYLIDDILKQMEDDVRVSEVNAAMRNDHFPDDVAKMYPTTLKDDPTISTAIKNSDTLVITIGANDVLGAITYDEEKQQMDIDVKTLLTTLDDVHSKKADLFNQIKTINPDIQIYDVGIYMAYSFIDQDIMQKIYPLLVYGESKIFFNQPKDGIYKVTIRDNMQADLQTYIDNPNDIHPDYQGYQVMGNEILKTIIENEEK